MLPQLPSQLYQHAGAELTGSSPSPSVATSGAQNSNPTPQIPPSIPPSRQTDSSDSETDIASGHSSPSSESSTTPSSRSHTPISTSPSTTSSPPDNLAQSNSSTTEKTVRDQSLAPPTQDDNSGSPQSTSSGLISSLQQDLHSTQKLLREFRDKVAFLEEFLKATQNQVEREQQKYQKTRTKMFEIKHEGRHLKSMIVDLKRRERIALHNLSSRDQELTSTRSKLKDLEEEARISNKCVTALANERNVLKNGFENLVNIMNPNQNQKPMQSNLQLLIQNETLRTELAAAESERARMEQRASELECIPQEGKEEE